MMSDFKGKGSKMTPKNRIIEGKNRIKGGGGVKIDSKKSDIIYEQSLGMYLPEGWFLHRDARWELYNVKNI